MSRSRLVGRTKIGAKGKRPLSRQPVPQRCTLSILTDRTAPVCREIVRKAL